MPFRFLVSAIAAIAALTAAAPAAAAPDFAPRHVVVRYDGDASRSARAAIQERTGTRYDEDLPGGARTLAIEDGDSVDETLAELRGDDDVASAHPDYEVR